ncbi:MAG: tRNA pseudouridine(55) synthase TruB, partial [Phycisphaerae bacterium]
MSVEGIINLNKPAGMSSAQAVYRLRRLTRVRKSGHAGTLDPRATGVLVICIGRATKLVESVMNHPKIYRTTARLDVTNETLDLDSPMEAVDCATPPSRDEIEAACRSWEGRVQQMPPLVSAIKYGGLPAYERVRRNESVVLVPRWIDIYWIHLRRYAWPEIEFDVCSGRGTYVRSLVRDLGAAVGAGGVITQLRRDRVGPFTLANAA